MTSFPSLLAVFLSALFLGALPAPSASAANDAAPAAGNQTAPARLAVLDFELVGDLGDASLAVEQRQRASATSAWLREALAESGLYEVVDNAPAAALIERLSAGQHLHRCNGCEFDIASQLGARYVLVPWVYRVSNLILTMHVEIRDAAAQQVVMKRALDFRGDNDKAWMRAAAYLVRDMKESASAGAPAADQAR